MYESLATTGAEGGAENVVSLARTLQGEERDDYDQYGAFSKKVRRIHSKRNWKKESFETQLIGFSKEVEDSTVQMLFRQHAEETKEQYTLLTQRLEELGGSTPSAVKSWLATLVRRSWLGRSRSRKSRRRRRSGHRLRRGEQGYAGCTENGVE
jgi:hypothetical protein